MQNTKNAISEYEIIVEKAATAFQNYYLDYLNNFISCKGYAEHYGISHEDAVSRITIGMKIHAKRTD